MSKTHIPEIPCEAAVRKVFGSQWRSLGDYDRDGAWGVAIIRSVLDGVKPELMELSLHLGVDREVLRRAFNRLSVNGVFRDVVYDDRPALDSGDIHAWCYYAGYASGHIGRWGGVKHAEALA